MLRVERGLGGPVPCWLQAFDHLRKRLDDVGVELAARVALDLRQRDIDGGLIGGAALKAADFAAICRAAAQ